MIEQDLPFLARTQARMAKRERKQKKKGQAKAPEPRIEYMINRVLAGELPRDIVLEITKSGSIAVRPRSMGVVRKTRKDKREDKE